MPKVKAIQIIIASCLLITAGCVTADKIVLDDTKRPETASVDIFKNGRIPERTYKDIAELSFLGPRQEEFKAQRRFVDQAKKLGGNGIIMMIDDAGISGGGSMYGSHVSSAWLFKARVIVYQ